MTRRITSQGSVYRNKTRPTWEFVVWVTDPGSKRGKRQVRRKGFTTRKAAEEALVELQTQVRAAVRNGQRIVRKPLTVEQFLEGKWLPTLSLAGRLKESTLSYYRFTSQYLVKELGTRAITDVTGSDLTRLYGTLKADGYSVSLIRGVHTTAHKAYAFALREGLVTWNPADRAEAPPTPKGKPHAWTDDEMRKLMGVADRDRYWVAWRLLASTGLRRGEICGLQWSDIEGDNLYVRRTRLVVDSQVRIETPKTTRSMRRIPLNRTAQEALQLHRLAQSEEAHLLGLAQSPAWIITNEVGKPIDPSLLSKRWRSIVKQAEVPAYSLHALRHTFATALLARNKSPKVVQDLLGHSSITVTLDLYTASLDNLGRDAVDALDETFSDQRCDK
jgi:integrase